MTPWANEKVPCDGLSWVQDRMALHHDTVSDEVYLSPEHEADKGKNEPTNLLGIWMQVVNPQNASRRQ